MNFDDHIEVFYDDFDLNRVKIDPSRWTRAWRSWRCDRTTREPISATLRLTGNLSTRLTPLMSLCHPPFRSKIVDLTRFIVHHHHHYLTGATLQWKVCRPLRFDDHVGVSSPGKPNAKGGLDQTGKHYGDLDDDYDDHDDEEGDDYSHHDQEVLYPNLIISELNDAVGGEEQSRELCGCRTGLSISVIMIFDDSTIGQK